MSALPQGFASPTGLPIRPSLAYYRHRAKEKLRQLRHNDPSAQLAVAQHELARENSYRSWRDFALAINARKERADRLEHALLRRDMSLVRRLVEQDRDAVLDVGAIASRQTLTTLLRFIDKAANQPSLPTVLLSALAQYHPLNEELPKCVELLLQRGADHQEASSIALARLGRLPDASARKAGDVIEQILGQFADNEAFDGDFDWMPESD